MRTRLAGFVVIGLLAVLAPTGRASVNNHSYRVDRVDDPVGPGRCSKKASDCSLRQAIAKAKAGDRVRVPALNAPALTTYTLTLGELVVRHPIRIIGAGRSLVTVTTTSGRIFRTDPRRGRVLIRDMAIEGGSLAAGDGGSAPATGTDGTDGVPGTQVTATATGGNGAVAEGAGVLSLGKLVLKRVRIANNVITAGDGGDATAVGGDGGDGLALPGGDGGDAEATGGAGGDAIAAGLSSHGPLTLRDCVIEDNDAIPGDGGDASGSGGDGGDGSDTTASASGGGGGDATANGGKGGDAFSEQLDHDGGPVSIFGTFVGALPPTVGNVGGGGSAGGNGGTGSLGAGGTGGNATTTAGAAGAET